MSDILKSFQHFILKRVHVDKRFIRSGCQAQMGGWLFLDMIQASVFSLSINQNSSV